MDIKKIFKGLDKTEAQAITNFSEKVSPEIRRLLTPALVQLGIGD